MPVQQSRTRQVSCPRSPQVSNFATLNYPTTLRFISLHLDIQLLIEQEDAWYPLQSVDVAKGKVVRFPRRFGALDEGRDAETPPPQFRISQQAGTHRGLRGKRLYDLARKREGTDAISAQIHGYGMASN